jgi:hypothetical protein
LTFRRHARTFFLLALLGAAIPAAADIITSADLQISGADFKIVNATVTAQLGTPALVQTSIGDLQNDQAPVFTDGTIATGELIGPGISTPVPFITAPGRAFIVSGLSQEGTYYLQNVRMMKGTQLLQVATPSLAVIQVTNALNATVTVKQLSADDLRKRGISLDPNNYDVFEYTFSFLVNGQTVEVPYPVIINRLTHEATPIPHESPYNLPKDGQVGPPRWNPPSTIPVEFPEGVPFKGAPPTPDNPDPPEPPRPQIHAAIVIPNSLAVLHEFFGLALVVTNGAPAGSGVTLDSITATIDAPNQLRVAKVDPPVTVGQPVTITGPGGVTILAAQVQGKSEWTLEGLKAGTYTVNLDINATFHSPGQPDVPLEAKPSAAIVIHDARFNIAFSHPDTIRKGLQYSTHTFITNVSEAAQDITLSDNGLPACSSGGARAFVCRVDSSPSSFSLHLDPGETKTVEYKLQSSLTGHVFATAVSIDGADSAINSAAFTLDMGVSPTGVPLSPVTLILPHYATAPYLSQPFLDDQLGLLGIGYSLATAPMNKTTAKFPRLIKSDIFTRAVDIARAGERIFIGDDRRDSLANLALDLLGNDAPLAEWDQFRRQEIADPAGDTARNAMTALASELAGAYGAADGTFNGMADRFAAATSDRVPYLLALAHGAKNGTAPSFAVRVAAGTQILDGVSSAASGWKRDIAYGEVDALDAASESATMALIGRTTAAVDITVTASVSGPATLDLIIPSADGQTLVRATALYTATAGQAVHLHVAGGAATSSEVTITPVAVAVAPIRLVAARQDLFLDPDGHVVSVLFNRRLPATTADLSTDFDTDVSLDPARFGITYSGKRPVAGAALQTDGRIIRLNYDGALSNDARYTIHTTGLVDPASASSVVPTIEDRNAALLFGAVLKGDNTPVPGAELKLRTGTGLQYQNADSSGRFLFEYVPRDPDNGLNGGYTIDASGANQSTTITGAVRLLHTVHQVNIVFLGRGSAKGTVRYEDGTPVAGATVVIGSTLFSQFRTGATNSLGAYSIADLPVGPLTFSAQDAAGNVAYAANELHGAGELVMQDVTIIRKAFPGTGTVRGRITRSDSGDPVASTHVGVYSQGYGLQDGFTDAAGRFEFSKVPSGFVTVLAENYAVAPRSIAIDFDLKPDEVRNLPDLVLAVQAATALVSVTGTVTIEDPYVAGHFTPVPLAQVQIDRMPLVTADGSGVYHYDAVPQNFAGSRVRAYDPQSGRVGETSLPQTLSTTATNNVPIVITNVAGTGTGTIRVHLLDAAGNPVSGYHVFEPGFPRTESEQSGEGVYEFADLPVGTSMQIVAAPSGVRDITYGYQWTQGGAGISFPGQIAAVTLRLPGQSNVHAVIKQATQAGVLVQVAGQLHLRHRVWSDAEQNPKQLVRLATTDGANDAVFDQVPAGEGIFLETFESVGYDATSFVIGFNGQPINKVLTLSTLASVRGHVFMPDGYTPVAGASVNLTDGAQDSGWIPTALDGSFEFKNVEPHSGFTVQAQFTQNGIYRTGYVTGGTPQNGGPVENVSVILLKQGAVEGSVVDAANQPIPFAKIWMRELSFPGRSFGTAQEPMLTDANGRFRFNNIFAVPFRIDAEDPLNPDLKGSFNGVVGDEAQVVPATLTVGGAGTGTVQITVKDQNNAFQPVANAEVSLLRGSLFDFGTTDLNGTVTFHEVPVGAYTASAYSKALAKFGATSTFAVAKDGTAVLTINLEFSGEVKGTLDDPQNHLPGVPGANVDLFGVGYQTRATTDTAGAFDFNGVREGTVDLVARDPNSIRQARNKATVTPANGTVIVPMHLEPTSTLTVKVFLPNDSGGSSGVLVPNVEIDVGQNAPGGQYHRTSQTNGDSFPGLVRKIGFSLEVKEIGGLSRTYAGSDFFDDATAAKEIDIVLAATGSVIVHVQQGNPATDAPNVQVTASSLGVGASAFTDAAGMVTLSRLPLGTVSIQARTLGTHPLTGATSVALNSQTHPASAYILLGSYGGVTGKVIAETGGPSAGTRVFAAFGQTTLESRTDSTGAYTFQGIATPPSGGTTIGLTYLGPDDNTIGATQSVVLHNGDGILPVPDVTLDSTPPRLVGIFPADSATKVAPDTQLKFTFSRAVRDDQLNSGFFKLFDVGAASQLTLTLASKQVLADNSEIVTFNTPPTPAGQHFPLKSNTLYRSEVSPDLQDLAGHKIAATLGASFTTSDYSNPTVIKVEPKSPLPKNNFRIAVTFSKPLAAAPWAPGGSGVMQLTPISALGGSVTGSPLPGQIQLDPSTGATLYFAPDVFLSEASFYRLTISGVVDLDGHGLGDASGNPLAAYTQDFFSYDTTPPGITIGNPIVNGSAIGANDSLYISTLYRFPVALTNAADLDKVDFFSVGADGVDLPLSRSTSTSVDVSLPQGTTTFTLKATASDLSGNKNTATRTWTVSQQPAISIVSATITPATIYAGNKLTDTVVISGGGLDEKVTITARIHGSASTLASASTNIARATFDSAWPNAVVQITIPLTTPGGAAIDVTEDVSDVRGGAATHVSSVTLATDTVPPQTQPLSIEVVSGASSSSFHNGDTFRVHAFARDDETGVKQVVFTVDGSTSTATSGTLRSSGFTEYVSSVFTVHARNNDLAMPVTAVVTDNAALTATSTAAVTYVGQHDPNAPTVAWIAPLHDAVWPAGVPFHAKLRVYAVSALPLTATFDVPTMTPAQAGTANGNEIDLDVTFAQTPAAGTPFQIVAHVTDGDGGHTADLPISIDLVAVTQTLHGGETLAVDATHPLIGDSILVDGGRLVPHVPVALKSLIVVNGGLVDTVPSTTTADQKLNLTVSGHLYVDDTSSIDVSRRGYLGGLQANFDSTGSNSDVHGMTLGRTTAGGAANGASASYAGIGGTGEAGPTNATYGSIADPADLGSGGAADSGNRRGGQGGGALAVGGAGKIVIAGAVLAAGESGQNIGGAGSGGSIHLTGSQIVVGSFGTVGASGGDDDGSGSVSRGGGGGRVALEATALMEIDTNNGARVVAHGGRNLTSEGAAVLEGGAGTIFLRAPGAADGDLVVSDYDPRNPSTAHSALSTVLGGTLRFDHLTVGPRGLARAEAPLTIGGVVDDRTKAAIDPTGALVLAGELPTITVTTTPAAGSSVIAGTKIDLTYTATSHAGVAGVTSTLAPVLAPITDAYAFPPTVTTTPAKALNIPQTTAGGAASLSVHVTDRAGRSADAAPSAFTIVANTPPAIAAFDVTAPSPLYIGASIDTSITATDDLGLTRLAMTSQLGTQTPVTQTFTPPANSASSTHAFSVAIPKDATLDGAAVTLTANAQDAAGAPGTSTTRTVPIAHDAVKPVVTITQPAANTPYDEGSSQLIHVVATAVDAETGLKTITARVEGGETLAMTPTANANEFAADLHIPSVPGVVQLTRTITVTATDFVNNATDATRPILINPSTNPAAPLITWNCFSDGAMAPAGAQITLSVTAIPGASGNPVDSITFTDGTTTLTADKSGNVYSKTYTVPSLSDGSVVTITATGTSGAGSQTEEAKLTVVVIDKTIPAGTIVNNGDATYDFQNVLVSSGTVTLIGHHEFKRLLVLGGATVAQKPVDASGTYGVDIKATLGMCVACNSSVDVSRQGYAASATYPGATPPGGDNGGSHIGLGASPGTQVGTTFGSVYHPAEAGAGGQGGGAGGGIVRIDAGALALDGTIKANGQDATFFGRSGAGGSVWIITGTASGAGSVEANSGVADYASGGGGAIAVEYGSGAAPSWTLSARTRMNGGHAGGAGTVLVKGPQSSMGDVTIDNGGVKEFPTVLPSLGSGVAQAGSSGATLVTDRSTNIPTYFADHWIEITSAGGTFKGAWRVNNSISNKTVTLKPNAGETISVQPGDKWQGVYRFDSLRVPTAAKLISADPIRLGPNGNGVFTLTGPATAGQTLDLTSPLTGTDVTLSGNITLSSVTSAVARIKSGSTIAGTPGNPSSVTMNVSGTLAIESGASINVTGQGYAASATYPGATPPGGDNGGSHIGLGGSPGAQSGTTFGSVYHPAEAGAGGQDGGAGGGVVRINAGALVLDGTIKANGQDRTFFGRSGAGGSIWVITGTVAGAGSLEANSGLGDYGVGGGGAIAVEYGSGSAPAWTMSAKSRSAGGHAGGAGTVLVKGPQSSMGDVTIDNGGVKEFPTVLPSLGSGVAQAGSSGATLVTDRSTDIPTYFADHWIEITSAGGTFKGAWRVDNNIINKTVTLKPNAGETISVQPGDKWQGVYRFDSLRVPAASKLTSVDPIRLGPDGNGVFTLNGPTAAGQTLDLTNPLTGTDVTLNGNFTLSTVTAATARIKSGTTINGLSGSPSAGVTMNVSGTLTIESGASINVSNQGYPATTTYPGATRPGGDNGGSHIGQGGAVGAQVGTTFGSVYRPMENGAGGESGGAGGGVVRLDAGALVLDGTIKANGQDSTFFGRSGAGGSVWITTTGTVAGSGSIEANSGLSDYAVGGGGAIAMEYRSGSAPAWTMSVKSRSANGHAGGAGSVLVKGPQSVFGALTVDDTGANGVTDLPALGFGSAVAGSGGAVLVTDRGADIPAYFAEHWVEIRDANGAVKGTWRIDTIDPANRKKVILKPNAAEPIDVQPGDQWRGVYKFDSLVLRNAQLVTADLVVLGAPVDKDAASIYIPGNLSAPSVDLAKISIVYGALGPAVSGTAGAVSDPDPPIVVTATNTRTGSTSTATAAADGSFTVGVVGAAGDTITVKARDSHRFPMESRPLTVGTLTSGTPSVSQINRTVFTNDGNFRLRILEQEGGLLVGAPRRINPGAGDSDKVVRIDITTPSAPTFVETIAGNNGLIFDIALLNGYAYVASDDLRVINFNVKPATLIIPDRFTDGYTLSVAATKGYAYVGEDTASGRIQLFDIANPQAPRFLRNQDLGGGMNFTKLLPLGSRYLIAITASGSNDINIIDRSDVNNLRIVKQLAIPQMAATRGRLIGNLLYVVDTASGLAIVDVSDPLNASLKSFTATNAAASGVDALGSDVVVANGAGGLAVVNAANPSSPALAGALSIPGTVWDVVLTGEYAYVAAEDSLAVVNVPTAPHVTPSLVSVTREASSARVTGAKFAVTGSAPLTVTLTDVTTGAAVSGLPVAADGSFSSTVPAASGDAIAVTATDGAGRSSGQVAVGSVPFGSAAATVTVTPGPNGVDGAFRARLMEIEGNTMVVTSWEGARSDRVLRFNISNPLAPQYVDTTPTNNNFVWDVALRNGYAFVASDDLRIVNMNVTPSQLIIPDRFTDGFCTSVAVDGTYAFVAQDTVSGRIQTFDISALPAAPHFLKNQDLGGGVNFHKMMPLGSSYLIAITPQGSNDVWIIDRRDINNLRVAAQLPIPGISGSTGRLVGNLLYVSERGGGTGVAVVDVSNPLAPALVSTKSTNGGAFGFDAAGSTLAVGDGASGVTFIDTTNIAAPRIIGSQSVPGAAWDVRFGAGALFVAHETGITAIPDVTAPPTVNASAINVARSAAGAVVTGAKNAIGGQGALTVTVSNRTTGATSAGVAVAADGSFSATIAGAPGNVIAVTAADGGGRATGPVIVGSIPFGAAVTTVPISFAMQQNDQNFRARLMEVEGSNMVVTSWEGARSDKVLRFNISNPLAPQYVDTTPTNNNFVWDVALRNGYAFVASDDLRVVNMNVTPSQLIVPDRFTDGYCISVTVDGTYAFVAQDTVSGRIQTFDVSALPAAPHFLKNQDLGGGVNFHKMILLGSSYLIAITPQGTNDVWIIDRRDVDNLRIAAQLPIPGISGSTGRLVGNLLYVSERGGGTGVAIVDVSNPLAPVLLSTRSTLGGAFGFDAAGSTLAVGDGGAGVTMIDTANPAAPAITGSQATPGTAWDVRFANGAMYVVHETGVSVVADVSVPPTLTTARIQVARSAAGGVITGTAGAVAGQGPFTLSLTNLGTNVTTGGIAVAADGSFSATLADAVPGHAITARAVDAAGRSSSTYALGEVPFGSSVVALHVSQAMQLNDATFRPRLMAIEGNTMVVTSWEGARSDKVLRFNIGNPSAPQFVDSLATNNDYVWDLVLRNGYAFIGGDDVRVVNTNVTPSQVIVPDRFTDGRTLAIAVDGTVLFAAQDTLSSRIQTFDVSALPAAPHFLKNTDLGGGANFTKLLLLGTNYLIAVTPQVTNDIWIIDRTDVNNLHTVAQLPIPAFGATAAKLVGNLLYVTERTAGKGVAVVDVSNPLAPVLRSTTSTRGYTFGVDTISGSLIAVGDGSPGITIFDAADPAAPRLLGTQYLGGATVWDAVYQNNTLWCTTQVGIAAVQNFATTNQ